MKKLLSILTITTLTASVPAPLLANTPLTRNKRDVGTTAKDVTNNYWTFIASISKEDATKNKDKYYFVIYKNKGESNWQIYKMQMGKPNDRPIFGETVESHKAFYRWDGVGEPNLPEINSLTGEIINWKGFDIKIKEKYGKENIVVWNGINARGDNNFYFIIWRGRKSDKWEIVKYKNIGLNTSNTIIATSKTGAELDRVSHNFSFSNGSEWADAKNDDGTYFKSVYRWDGVGEPNLPEINPNTGNITNWKQPTKNDFQQGILFSLVDGSKTATWSNNGMRLTVDGETNININNPNVTEVYWDGSLQPQLSKQWKINVKPETAPRDHKLVIKYNINGTKYTSEDIMVSMLAKIDSTPTPVQQNLSDLIKNTDLGNIIDNNDDTIFLAVNKANSEIIDDFSQIEITKKVNHSATLSAKPDSKSYKGSVDIKYNVVPATVVDLKIELKPTVSSAIVNKDYLAQLDSSKMTNKVDTFYYANSESVITMVKPTDSSVITGVVYGCDDKWNKTSQSSNIDPAKGIKLDGSQLGAVQGRYLIDLKNELGQTNTIYLQIHSEKDEKAKAYWNTDNGKQFEQWAQDQEQGYENIRGSSASQLNNLFELSKTWKQSLKHLDLKLDNFVVDNIKNVSQDEIDNYKTKLLASVKAQVEKYVPGVVEKTDYVISVDNLVAGDWTTSKDVKVQAVDGSTKLLSFTVKTIPVQQKEEVTALASTPVSSDKGGKSIWKILGIVAGSLAGLGLAYWLFKRFVFNKYFLPKIKRRRHLKLVEQVRKEEAEKDAQNNKGGEE
ncbi:DUF3688 family protein [Spiroplasma melliferum]|uniref:Adhesin n=2 Tax=Spiroplasma melliferum TaxID=2134 RepID=A0AAI9T1Y8_SPIME|nr:DUF3688 family protein [Spiroplasma melliferum]KAI92007.1 hypothetical protein SPM_006725 [Spiroplasma melliferum KC3]QCO23232.1 hypothetical protein SRED_003094 [Spiroplasma melliferum]QCO23246.1 hypothetical protein SRED_003108 [Spiroplasma melliferum]